MRNSLLAAMAFLIVPATANAVDYLTEVVSDVQQAPGMSATQIVDRAQNCIKSTSGNASEHVNPTVDGDTVYAIVRGSHTTMPLVSVVTRSRLSVVAREGRFKVAHTDIEILDNKYGNHQVIKQWGTGWQKTEAALSVWATEVASCIVTTPEVAGGEW
jgi:hypothetical protein